MDSAWERGNKAAGAAAHAKLIRSNEVLTETGEVSAVTPEVRSKMFNRLYTRSYGYLGEAVES